MKFIDEVEIEVRAGDGGNGVVAFRREKYRPKCGPSGGDGGRGGSVILVASPNVNTLLDLRIRRQVAARSGQHGQGNDCYGRSADDVRVKVPVGTQVTDVETGQLLGDLTEPESFIEVAKGGIGGLGNIHFATPSNQAPRQCTPGESGEARTIRLELKLLADVGLVGFPSVGKSSIIARMSAARPRIAEYPFTTLVPNLGVVRVSDDHSFVIADIPGIIENASSGAGLGIRFLKHIQRTAVLVYVLALDATLENDLVADLAVLRQELATFDETLLQRPAIIVINKSDLTESQAQFEAWRTGLETAAVSVLGVSAATGQGLDELKRELSKKVSEYRLAQSELMARPASDPADDSNQ